jgi:ankyrin repeat protein
VLDREARGGHADAVCSILDLHPAVDSVASRTRALHSACWAGRGEVVKLLVDRGVDLAWKNEFGGDALGAARHGSHNCHDTDGGTTSQLSEEVPPRDYAAIVRMLTAMAGRG